MLFWKKKPVLTAEDQEKVINVIREAEARTTGEIRVYVESHCAYMDAMDRAVEIFAQLGMDQTERRNAVLIYIATDDHQFAIFGDVQIFERAGGPLFWEKAAVRLKEYLRAGNLPDGLIVCVQEIGTALAQHFPYDPEVIKNELPDEIVFGK